MKVILLGTGIGTSGIPGVPDRFPPGILVDTGSELILFDCSEGIRFRIAQAGYDFTDIHHIAISHPHADHNALSQLLLALHIRKELRKEQIPHHLTVYSSEDVRNSLLLELQAHWQDHEHAIDKVRVTFDVLNDGESRRIDDAILSSRTVYHQYGKIDARAFRLETSNGVFVYSGDTGWCEGIREIAKDADIFICEASANLGKEYYEGGWGHLSAYQAGEIAREARVRKLILTHYTGLDSDEKLVQASREAGFENEVLVGKDFQEFIL